MSKPAYTIATFYTVVNRTGCVQHAYEEKRLFLRRYETNCGVCFYGVTHFERFGVPDPAIGHFEQTLNEHGIFRSRKDALEWRINQLEASAEEEGRNASDACSRAARAADEAYNYNLQAILRRREAGQVRSLLVALNAKEKSDA